METENEQINEQMAELEDNAAEETVEETEAPAEGETEEASPGEEGTEEAEGEEGAEEGAEGEEGEEEEPAYKPATKFKAGVYNKETRQLEQKEFDIDPRFHSLMTDPESEKAVRELHEKAFGLESVKERFQETKQAYSEVAQENTQIKGSINSLRSTYQAAVQTGNWHKLDNFFQQLQIPQEHILRYAMAKVELNEMDPAQRNAILAQQESENRAEMLARQQADTSAQAATQAAELKRMMVDATLAQPAVASLVEAFDARVGKPDSFKNAMIAEGQLAWATEQVDLTPQQAAQRVISKYGLQTDNPLVPPAQKTGAGQGTPAGGQKRVIVQRTDKTIPNVGGNSNSPLAKKPKSMDDVLKYRKREHGF